ncbi:Dabb family protein [Panacibacter ginsenosidivorans]|nr:Dabb family protein [Panacibacter ginsenosidivorans]
MKKIFFAALMLLTVALLLHNKATAQSNNAPGDLLRHIVMITFKKDAPADSIQALDNIYKSLSKSTMVKDFEMGINMSIRDTLVKHVFVTTFTSKDDLANYKKVPAYSGLFKLSLAIAEDVTVADYWVKK